MKLREHVAELRRHLPPGSVVKDYEFVEGPADLSAGEIADPDRPFERIVHCSGSLARYLPVYVWKAPNEPVSNVHASD